MIENNPDGDEARQAAARQAAATRKRKAAGRKAAETKKRQAAARADEARQAARQAAARKAVETKKRKRAARKASVRGTYANCCTTGKMETATFAMNTFGRAT